MSCDYPPLSKKKTNLNIFQQRGKLSQYHSIISTYKSQKSSMSTVRTPNLGVITLALKVITNL